MLAEYVDDEIASLAVECCTGYIEEWSFNSPCFNFHSMLSSNTLQFCLPEINPRPREYKQITNNLTEGYFH